MCVCVRACVRACVCACMRACVFTGCIYFLPPEVINVQAKVSGDHEIAFQLFESSCHCQITETEGEEKCHFKTCMLTDTQHSSMYPCPISASVDQLFC